MSLDLFLLGILAVMAALGAWRGAVVSALGLLGLAVGYAGGIAGAGWGSEWVARTLVVSPLVAPAIAGTLGFVAAWLVVSSLAGVLVAWDRRRIEDTGRRGGIDRAVGATCGLVRGGLIVVMVSILASWIDAGRSLGALTGWEALPAAEDSTLVGVSSELVEATVAGALAEAGPAGDLAARLTARPLASLAHAKGILEDELFEAFLADKLFWTAIQSDSVGYAMNRVSVRAIAADPELRGRFAELGLVGEEARTSPEAFRETMTQVLAELAPRLRRLQHDPELRALARDPAILARLESGDTLGLIADPRVRKLAQRISASDEAGTEDAAR